jgi:glycosyltransferase involved in cell wall biosynthesis
MRLIKLPTIKNKYFDTLVHALLSSVHALFQPYDICLYFIAGNSVVTWIPRLAGKRTIINVDGLDWKREKWPPFARAYIRFAERMAGVLANAVVTDSHVVQKYYKQAYGITTEYIAYGSDVKPLPPGDTLRKWGLEPRRYVLFVGRLVPENCAHHLVEAYCMLSEQYRRHMKCVIVGDAPYAEEYIADLRARACNGVVFTGYLFGDGYRELSSSAYCFVETSGVGGTHPALLEAMGFGNCVVAHDTPENLEAMGPVGLSYNGRQGAESLRQVLEHLIRNPQVVEERRALCLQYARHNYSWEAVTDRYLELFYRVLGRGRNRQRQPGHKNLR